MQNTYEEALKKIDDFLGKGKKFKIKEDILAKNFSHCFEDFVIFGGYPEIIKARTLKRRGCIYDTLYNQRYSWTLEN